MDITTLMIPQWPMKILKINSSLQDFLSLLNKVRIAERDRFYFFFICLLLYLLFCLLFCYRYGNVMSKHDITFLIDTLKFFNHIYVANVCCLSPP